MKRFLRSTLFVVFCCFGIAESYGYRIYIKDSLEREYTDAELYVDGHLVPYTDKGYLYDPDKELSDVLIKHPNFKDSIHYQYKWSAIGPNRQILLEDDNYVKRAKARVGDQYITFNQGITFYLMHPHQKYIVRKGVRVPVQAMEDIWVLITHNVYPMYYKYEDRLKSSHIRKKVKARVDSLCKKHNLYIYKDYLKEDSIFWTEPDAKPIRYRVTPLPTRYYLDYRQGNMLFVLKSKNKKPLHQDTSLLAKIRQDRIVQYLGEPSLNCYHQNMLDIELVYSVCEGYFLYVLSQQPIDSLLDRHHLKAVPECRNLAIDDYDFLGNSDSYTGIGYSYKTKVTYDIHMNTQQVNDLVESLLKHEGVMAVYRRDENIHEFKNVGLPRGPLYILKQKKKKHLMHIDHGSPYVPVSRKPIKKAK